MQTDVGRQGRFQSAREARKRALASCCDGREWWWCWCLRGRRFDFLDLPSLTKSAPSCFERSSNLSCSGIMCQVTESSTSLTRTLNAHFLLRGPEACHSLAGSGNPVPWLVAPGKEQSCTNLPLSTHWPQVKFRILLPNPTL